jgi:hypothetical protein
LLVHHFHVVCTLPAELRALLRVERRRLCGQLMKALPARSAGARSAPPRIHLHHPEWVGGLAEIGSESVGVKKEQSIRMLLLPRGLPRAAVMGQDTRGAKG